MTWQVGDRVRMAPMDLTGIPTWLLDVVRNSARGGLEQHEEGDFQDFVEDAFRLAAGLTLPEPELVKTGTGGPWWGALGNWEGLHTPQNQTAQSYWQLSAWRSACGRPDFLVVDERSIPAAFRLLLAQGRPVWLKGVEQKSFMARFETQEEFEQDDELSWWRIRHEGQAASMMLYTEVPMECEYRVFIVDGRPVSAAGCVEKHTPLDNDQTAFDRKVERVRGDGKVISLTNGELEAYLAFASHQAEWLQYEAKLDHYVMDLAFSHGKPLIIELNGLTNAGLYASDPFVVAAAMAISPSPLTLENL